MKIQKRNKNINLFILLLILLGAIVFVIANNAASLSSNFDTRSKARERDKRETSDDSRGSFRGLMDIDVKDPTPTPPLAPQSQGRSIPYQQTQQTSPRSLMRIGEGAFDIDTPPTPVPTVSRAPASPTIVQSGLNSILEWWREWGPRRWSGWSRD